MAGKRHLFLGHILNFSSHEKQISACLVLMRHSYSILQNLNQILWGSFAKKISSSTDIALPESCIPDIFQALVVRISLPAQ